MPVVGLVGPNAIGKTTAALRWQLRYPQIKITNEIQGLEREKELFTATCRIDGCVWVMESSRTTHLNYFKKGEPVIVVSCPWQLLEEHMRERCEKRGKEFKPDYWHPTKLKYEAGARYLNWLEKYLSPEQVQHFEINDQARDWPAVDEYFGKVYRRLHNELVSKKQ